MLLTRESRSIVLASSRYADKKFTEITPDSVTPKEEEREVRFRVAEQKYPRIYGSVWQGMRLMELGSSLNSISSSIEDYEELPGIREMPYVDFGDPKKHFYAVNDWKHADVLAERVRYNQKIEPLIVGIDSKGPYILEGQHRFVALSKLGHQTFPALVLIDYDT